MALPRRIPVRFEDVFPHGAFVLGVEAARDFVKAQAGEADVQERDKDTGELLWTVRVMDPDPTTRAGSAEVKVKMAAAVMPVAPEPLAGTMLRPVEFIGLTVMPWVNSNGSRAVQAFAYRATGLRAPRAITGKAAA
ncbi:plasmid replication, integration and excision activator [Frankia sp. CiP1_Cm_nod2]|uniref:plasmid replication, integration and excision activator n=1 Tax=Frankia sp. CiP1_Cm_nod2 TaxID=2897161 RepID=UPI00202577B3